MTDKTPISLPGALLVPKLLAYELAKACEEEEMESMIAIVVDSKGLLYIRLSTGLTAAEIAFAGTMLQREAVDQAMDPSLQRCDEGEDEE